MLARLLRQPTLLALLLLSAALLVLALLLAIGGPILVTLAISFGLYAALRPSVDAMVRGGMRDTNAVALTLLLITLLLLLVILMLLPMVAEQIAGLSRRMDAIDRHLVDMFQQLSGFLLLHFGLHFDPADMADSILEDLSRQAAAMGEHLSQWFDHAAFSMVLIPLLVFFLLRDYRQLRNKTMQLLPNRYFELGWLVYNGMTAKLQSYLRGLSIQGLVMACTCTLGFYLVGLEFAPLLGVLTALLNLIPFFGIALAKIPPLLVVLLADDPSILDALMALAVVFVAQAVDTLLVMPRIVARSADLHPLTVMLSVVLAGYHYGFFGMILAIPLLFSIKVVFLELWKGLRRLHPGSG